VTNPKCPECGIEIDDHPAGRCLDWWIARDVIGSEVLGFEIWMALSQHRYQCVLAQDKDEIGMSDER